MSKTKDRLIKLVKIVLFTALVFGSIVLLGALIKPDSSIEYPNSRDYSAYQIFKERDNSIDVVAFGHSHTYNAISPMEMYKETGITSYTCARSVQMPEESYQLLTELLQNQTPKVVVFEVGQLCYSRVEGYGLFSQYIEIERYNPIFQNHLLWKNWLPGQNYTERDAAKGYRKSEAVRAFKGSDNMAVTDRVYKIKENYIKIMDNMQALCESKGIQLLFFKIPSKKNWDYANYVAVKQYAESRGIKYLDANFKQDEIGLDWSKDTCDYGDHLNAVGAVKFSKWLARYLKDEYSLEDRRDNPEYISWQEDYNKYYGIY